MQPFVTSAPDGDTIERLCLVHGARASYTSYTEYDGRLKGVFNIDMHEWLIDTKIQNGWGMVYKFKDKLMKYTLCYPVPPETNWALGSDVE